MKKDQWTVIKRVIQVSLFTACTLFYAFPALCENVSARLGVMVRSGDEVRRAKSKEHLTIGDMLRVYIMPGSHQHLYLVHSDTKIATLLLAESTGLEKRLFTAPSAENFFQVDGKSREERLTIICAMKPLPEIMELEKTGQLPHTRWAEIETQLKGRSTIQLTQTPTKSIALMGNLRSAGKHQKAPFADNLLKYSGSGLLLKTFRFTVDP